MDEATEAENGQPFVAYATKGCPDIVIWVSEKFYGIRMSQPADATLLEKIRTGAIASQEFAPEHRALL